MAETNSASRSKGKNLNMDSILEELGPTGLYQLWTLVLLCIPNLFSAMYSMNFVFTADDVQYRCHIPECESGPNLVYDEQITWDLVPHDTRCVRYAPLGTSVEGGSCDLANYNINKTIPCTSWIYESNDTIVPEFNLACQDFKRTMVGSIRNLAVAFALILTGFTSDRWGRKTAFCIFAFFACTVGIIKSFSVSYEMYVTMEFFEAFLGYGFNGAGYVLIVELARPYLRVIFTSMTGITFGLGGAIFGVIAMYVPYWRELLRVIHTPACLLLLYIFLIDESARWLYVKGRKEEAARIIKKAARWNKVILSEDALRNMEIAAVKLEKEFKVPQKNIFLQLLKSRVLMTRFAVCSFCWIASTFVYYGLSINSVSLSGNKYINYSLSSLMEVVASILIMMSLERFGRKKCIMAAFILCGVCCFLPRFISQHTVVLTLFFTGKIGITYAFNSVYVYTSELFPTEARSSLLSACSLVGRIGSILAPQTPLLGLLFPTLPHLLFSGAALTAGLLLLRMPETLNTRLPETVDDAEQLGNLRDARNVIADTKL